MNEKHERIIGLDIGSNSVGWAVVSMKDNELVEIHGMGSRIIPSNDDTRNFEQGKAQTRNADRRRYRSMRRNNHRYKLRRRNLVTVLKLIGAWPERLGENLRPEDTLLTAMDLYGLRAKAVEEAIGLEELGRVLYHMNQRRGYKDIGELMDELQGQQAEEEETERNTLVEVRQVRVEQVTVEDDKGKREILRVQLADGTVGTTTQASFKDLIGQELYIQVRTKRTSRGDSISFSRVSVSDWLKNKDELDKKIAASGKHPGQYFHQELLDNPVQLPRFRERVVLRDRYKGEFEAIWRRQAEAHPVLVDPTVRDRVLEALIPNNLPLRAQWANKDLLTIVRDFVIYYQRPLRSQTASKGQCRFERKTVAPVSSPVYQLFRIWQQVNNIMLRDKYMNERPLDPAQREIVVQQLLDHERVSEAGVLRALKLAKSGLETSMRTDLPGHTTLSRIRKVLGEHACWEQLVSDARRVRGAEQTLLFRIWHILYAVPEQEHRRASLKELLSLDEEMATALAKVRFERKHGSVSARAASRLTQLMVSGTAWSPEQWPESLQRRVQQVIDERGTGDMKPEMRDKVAHLTSIEHYQGLQYWIAASVVYGDHRAQEGGKLDTPDQVRSMPRGFLRNPTVEQVVNEALMVVRDIWKDILKGERPTSFRIELARELRQSIDERKRTDERNRSRERDRKKVVERLEKEFGKARPTGKDIERYELWVRQKHQCIYSGTPIEASALFSREVDVDHIIPRSLFYDDSLQNKVLCLRRENAGEGAKNNQLAALYMKGKGAAAYEDYVKRIADLELPFGKRKFLLAEEVPDSFISRQMNETRYIGTELRKLLERIAPVNTTVGQVTDALKNEWGLNAVYKEVLLPRFERLERITGRRLIEVVKRTNGAGHTDYRIEGYDKRIDHRHHALDALVVALTRQKYIQKIAQMRQKGEPLTQDEAAGKLTWWPLPHRELRAMVKAELERTIPSIKSRQRLLTKAANRTAWYDAAAGVVRKGREGRPQRMKDGQRLLAVRGKLHEEQPMGEVRRQERMPIDKVLKRLVEVAGKEGPLHELRPLEKSDPAYRSRFLAHERERTWLEERLAKHDGDPKAALNDWKKNPPVNGKGVPVLALTVLVPYYTMSKAFGQLFSPTMVNGILDTKVRLRVGEHLRNNGNDPKKAFTTDALFDIHPTRHVRYKVDDMPIGKAKSRLQILRKDSHNTKSHFESGKNYAVLVEVPLNGGKREFTEFRLMDAVGILARHKTLKAARDGWKQWILRKGDLVYVPPTTDPDYKPDWTNKAELVGRIFRMTQTAGYFIPAHMTGAINYGAKPDVKYEFGTQDAAFFDDPFRDDRIKVMDHCIPIEINRLGNIETKRT
ncbi:MAG: CRISPR-associated endonuclease Cas9 [Flavobacteriales bacterium]|nr:CRISPR-associated endonuclease Cas9 [Flavobacteriales bacterium]